MPASADSPSPAVDILSFLSPDAIAVVGASEREGSLGGAVLHNLLTDGYPPGRLHPVSLKASRVFGLPAYASPEEIPGPVTMAIIAIPAAGVVETLEACGRKGIRNVVVLSAGFRETAETGAIAGEIAVVETCRRFGMTLLGPNCLGFLNRSAGINATFAKRVPGAGNVSFLSQSGAVGVYALQYAASCGLGLSKFLSLGNKAGLGENEALRALGNDPETAVILAYLEDFTDPVAFFGIADALTRAVPPKPVLLLKAGTGESGMRAALSHTGALARPAAFLPDLCAQAGVFLMPSLEEMLDTARLLSLQPLPQGPRLAILTNAGGPAILAADEAERLDLKVPELSAQLQATLQSLLPRSAGVHNPVDVLGDADAARFEKAFDALAASGEVDAILLICTPQLMTDMGAVAGALGDKVESLRARGVTVAAAFADFESALPLHLTRLGIPCYGFPENAVRALAAAMRCRLRGVRHSGSFAPAHVSAANVECILMGALRKDRQVLDPQEAMGVLRAYGLPVVRGKLARGREDIRSLAGTLNYPLVAKIVSSSILHKSEAGGVVTGIANPRELEEAHERLLANARRFDPGAPVEGILLQEMVRDGVEIILGAVRDPHYGPLILFGLGGTGVEALRDVTYGRVPLRPADAEDMIRNVRGKALLGAFRNRPARDLQALKDCLLRLSRLVHDHPQIREMDLNPVFSLEQGALVADTRILIAPSSLHSSPRTNMNGIFPVKTA